MYLSVSSILWHPIPVKINIRLRGYILSQKFWQAVLTIYSTFSQKHLHSHRLHLCLVGVSWVHLPTGADTYFIPKIYFSVFEIHSLSLSFFFLLLKIQTSYLRYTFLSLRFLILFLSFFFLLLRIHTSCLRYTFLSLSFILLSLSFFFLFMRIRISYLRYTFLSLRLLYCNLIFQIWTELNKNSELTAGLTYIAQQINFRRLCYVHKIK